MSVFDLDEAGQVAVDAEALRNPIIPDHIEAGFWDNTASGIGSGVMAGAAKLGRMGAFAIAAPLARADNLAGTPGKMSDPYFRWVDEHLGSAVDYWTPRPEEVGTAGRVLGGLAEIGVPLLLGGGNPTPLIANVGVDTATQLSQRGVDAGAAITVGGIQSAATLVGFKVPFFGRTLAQRMASGVAGNVAVNIPAAYGSQAVLEAGGYDQAAAGFDPWNLEARALDVLTGAVFGGIAHAKLRERDALAAVNNARHYQHDTAPGHPADVGAVVAHQRAMDAATEALVTGRPIELPPAVLEARFVDTPELAARRAARNAAIEAERAQLGGAWDGVLDQPQGDAYDPLVLIRPADIDDVLVARGGAEDAGTLTRVGDITVEGSGWGIVKFQWKHGERSGKRPGRQITRDDLLAFPHVIREFEPSRAADGARGREWRVMLPGADGAERIVVFADKNFGDGRPSHLVTLHTDTPKNSRPLSVRRSPVGSASRGEVFGPAPSDTAGGLLIEPPQAGRPGDHRIPPVPDARKSPADGQAARIADPDVVVAREIAATDDVAVPTGEIDADGNPVARSARELLDEADAAIANAEQQGKGIQAAVACFLQRGSE